MAQYLAKDRDNFDLCKNSLTIITTMKDLGVDGMIILELILEK